MLDNSCACNPAQDQHAPLSSKCIVCVGSCLFGLWNFWGAAAPPAVSLYMRLKWSVIEL